MFDYKNWREEISFYLDQETTTDDIIYGNYVEWDRFRQDYEEELLAEAGLSLPWDKILSRDEYLDLLKELSGFGVENIEYLKECMVDTKLLEVKFIPRSNEVADIIVSECLDLYGVPSGTEYEQELPTELTYWNSMLDSSENELLAYKKYPIKIELFDTKIYNIFKQIALTSDELTKKSLLLAIFSITESMFKSTIVDKIPQENNISDFSKKILVDEIEKRLRGNNDIKDKLFKDLYNKSAPKQKWVHLRNSLAHDIESSDIINNQINYLNLKSGKYETYLFSNLENDIIDFLDEIKNILDGTRL